MSWAPSRCPGRDVRVEHEFPQLVFTPFSQVQILERVPPAPLVVEV